MDISKYSALFLAESREHLSTCNLLLLEWEREPSATEPVGGLFRAIHTIKGMAATMGYTGVADLAHRMENLLDGLRQGRVAAGSGVFQLMFRSVDALSKAVESASGGADSVDEGLFAELDAAAKVGVAEPGPRGARPSSRKKAAEPAPSRPVQVTIRPEATMRGARAALVLRRAESLGAVSGVRPPAAQLDRDDFDGQLFFRLVTRSPDEQIVAALRSAGEVQSVKFEEAGVEQEAAVRGRQIRVDLRRLDTLMKQVGELVVAKNRLGGARPERRRPDPRRGERSHLPARLGDAERGDRGTDDPGGRGVRPVPPPGARSRAGSGQADPVRHGRARRSSSTARSSMKSASPSST